MSETRKSYKRLLDDQKAHLDLIESLKVDLQNANEKSKHWFDEYMKAQQEKGKAMGNAFEAGKQKKILAIIDHITAGRPNEAIQELLQPLPVVIGLDIRFSEDTDRIAYENDIFNKLKKNLILTIEGAKIERKEKDKPDSAGGEEPVGQADGERRPGNPAEV